MRSYNHSWPSSPWRKGTRCLPDSHPTAMSCYDLCAPNSCGPTPLANSCNEPCVRQCQDSTYVIQPSPVVVTLPGPILSSFPQNTAVGSSASAAVGDALSAGGVPINSGSMGGPTGAPTAAGPEGAAGRDEQEMETRWDAGKHNRMQELGFPHLMPFCAIREVKNVTRLSLGVQL
uniref:Keratin n=1 Tax=Junco hyemalis TaxID=40217 RepID=A0A8C5IX68_JUNHY